MGNKTRIRRKWERSDVKYPMWRKKVDASLFHYNGTTIPGWVCDMWNIEANFRDCISKRASKSKVIIMFEGVQYDGWITSAKQSRKTPAYRLWFSEDLQYKIKDVFLMSFMRDIEYRLRKNKSINIEDEIPFWEFLDIEYDERSRTILFYANYTQKPDFPELFQRLIGSPMMRKIDDELEGKEEFRIYTQGWKPREELDSEIEAANVLYTLIDTNNKLIYIGEANKLVERLRRDHPSVKDWNYYRYSVLPNKITVSQRKMLERMLIRDFASMIKNKANIQNLNISKYQLANDKIN